MTDTNPDTRIALVREDTLEERLYRAILRGDPNMTLTNQQVYDVAKIVLGELFPETDKPLTVGKLDDVLQCAIAEGDLDDADLIWEELNRGVKGEVYPCKDDIFQATHDFVSVH